MAGAKPTPSELWQVAWKEHGDDEEARKARYRELLIEHGHLIKGSPGTPRPLPCGRPEQRPADA